MFFQIKGQRLIVVPVFLFIEQLNYQLLNEFKNKAFPVIVLCCPFISTGNAILIWRNKMKFNNKQKWVHDRLIKRGWKKLNETETHYWLFKSHEKWGGCGARECVVVEISDKYLSHKIKSLAGSVWTTLILQLNKKSEWKRLESFQEFSRKLRNISWDLSNVDKEIVQCPLIHN